MATPNQLCSSSHTLCRERIWIALNPTLSVLDSVLHFLPKLQDKNAYGNLVSFPDPFWKSGHETNAYVNISTGCMTDLIPLVYGCVTRPLLDFSERGLGTRLTETLF